MRKSPQSARIFKVSYAGTRHYRPLTFALRIGASVCSASPPLVHLIAQASVPTPSAPSRPRDDAVVGTESLTTPEFFLAAGAAGLGRVATDMPTVAAALALVLGFKGK